jgi:hypothetical protein
VTALIERTAQSNPRLHGSQKTVPGYFLNCVSPQGGQAARFSKLYSSHTFTRVGFSRGFFSDKARADTALA